ncbi:MAG: enoyl-CoA hydratase-related protein [Alphaproteobacteria bacterium]
MHTILLEPHGAVLIIRLNRPQALNALNAQLLSELSAALAAADQDPGLRCIILTGSDKAFAAGADIREMAERTFAEAFATDVFGQAAATIQAIRKPIIAAVSGFCLGGGCELAMLCDFILCSDTAKFGQPEINLGVIPGMGGSQRLTRLIGKSKSMDMHLTARFMDAAEAERAGLVSRVFPLADLIPESLKAAQTIAQKSALATRATKEVVNRAYETTLAEGLLFERRLFQSLFATQDQKEGMAAFLAKRPAQFHDK